MMRISFFFFFLLWGSTVLGWTSTLPFVSTAYAQNCTYVRTTRLNGSTLRLRQSPNTSSSILASIPEGTCLKSQGSATGQNIKGNSTWYRVTYNGRNGWISGYYADCSNCGGPPPECAAGQTKACYTGPSGTKNRGSCREGRRSCRSGKWSACENQTLPKTESCNGKDDDCDGKTDENNPGGGGSCNTSQSGPCRTGAKRCEGGRIVCKTLVKGSNEICDKIDNDCDGKVDEGLQRNCYSGPANTNGVGPCRGGKSTCVLGKWGACTSQVTPKKESCDNKVDDDCDGTVDENCKKPDPKPQTCKNGETRVCYSADPNTRNKGRCKDGSQTCQDGGWSPCIGEVRPGSSETCFNKIDDNCDGTVDENCQAPTNCQDNDGDGFFVGATCQGPQDCDDSDRNVNPNQAEICGNGKDDDCAGGDSICGKIAFGQTGCRDSDDCETGVCAKTSNSSVLRCTQACKTKQECPAGYNCIGQTACWPIKAENVPTGKPCQSDENCNNGQRCEQGFCEEVQGCGCQSTPTHSGASLWFWMLLILGVWRLLRRPHTP